MVKSVTPTGGAVVLSTILVTILCPVQCIGRYWGPIEYNLKAGKQANLRVFLSDEKKRRQKNENV